MTPTENIKTHYKHNSFGVPTIGSFTNNYDMRELTTAISTNYGAEKQVMTQKEIREAKHKFEKKGLQHFNIMLKVRSPKDKYREAERQRLLKVSLTEVVGN